MELFFMQNPNFKEVHVKGEVSGVNCSARGNLFFNLKDKNSVVPCVILRNNRRNVDFEIVDGMKLLVIANVEVYRPHGKYQLDVFEVSEDGLGKLFVKFQQLKEKLTNEGLFNAEFKKDIPEFPKRIGVITSKEGSVIHDIIRTVNQNWPYCRLFLFPSQVQGQTATKQLISQIKRADSFGLDTLIIARGGGSIEDLWCFNEESLVRTVFECNTPVISAIGHETDSTLCNYVSDKNASTPTMAANFAINDKEKISNEVKNYNARLLTFISSIINDYKRQFNYMISKQLFTDSNYIYGSKKTSFNNLCNRFEYNSNMLITSKKNMLNKIKSEYVIKHPCKIQLDSSRLKLNELESRLVEAMNSIIKSDRHNLDKLNDKFKFSSNKYITEQKFRLNNIKTSYQIENPCKIQLNQSNLKLNDLKSRLTTNMESTIKTDRHNLDKLSDEFKFSSNKYLTEQKFRLNNIKTSYQIENPCKIQLNQSNLKLNDLKTRLSTSMGSTIKRDRHDFDKLNDKFKFSSKNYLSEQKFKINQIKTSVSNVNPSKTQIKKYNSNLKTLENNLIKSFEYNIESNEKDFNNLLNSNLFKNPDIIYNQKNDDLDKIKNENVIKNPYLLLNKHKQRLDINKEKLDKINQVLTLKQDQEKQKSKYQKIIIVFVVILIIIILLIYGGI